MQSSFDLSPPLLAGTTSMVWAQPGYHASPQLLPQDDTAHGGRHLQLHDTEHKVYNPRRPAATSDGDLVSEDEESGASGDPLQNSFGHQKRSLAITDYRDKRRRKRRNSEAAKGCLFIINAGLMLVGCMFIVPPSLTTAPGWAWLRNAKANISRGVERLLRNVHPHGDISFGGLVPHLSHPNSNPPAAPLHLTDVAPLAIGESVPPVVQSEQLHVRHSSPPTPPSPHPPSPAPSPPPHHPPPPSPVPFHPPPPPPHPTPPPPASAAASVTSTAQTATVATATLPQPLLPSSTGRGRAERSLSPLAFWA